jgi:hypothetical protein
MSELQELIEDNDISEEDSPTLLAILKDFISMCCIDGDLFRPNIKTQTIFRNLAG